MDEEKKEEEKPEEVKETSQKKFNLTEKIRENPWILATFVCGALVVILLASTFLVGVTGNVVSKEKAADNLMNYLTQSIDPNIILVGITNKGNMYTAVISYEGEEIPIYLTKDGSYYTTTLFPITAEASSETSSASNTPTEIPKSDKPTVQLFVMSHCPYGVKAQEVLLPVLKLLGTKATITVNFVDYAMHGKTEIDDNNIEYCLQKEQPSAFIKFLDCFVTSENSTQCLISSGANKNQLDSCIAATNAKYKTIDLYNDKSTWLSGQYPQYPVEKDLNDKLGVQGSESLIINGIKISPSEYRWDSNKLKDLVCLAFNDVPSECSQKLSSTTNSDSSVSGSCS
jgi:hypothetical protein